MPRGLVAEQDENRRLLAQVRARAAAERELVLADERARSTRELHDGLGHRLTVIGMSLEYAERMRERDPDKAFAEVAEARGQAADALEYMRRWVRALNPPRESELGGMSAFDATADSFRGTGLVVEVHGEGTESPLSQAASLFAYRLVQEGLTNVLRHLSAGRVDITVAWPPGEVELRVADDGVARGDDPRPLEVGFGLRSLDERAASWAAPSTPVGTIEARSSLAGSRTPAGRGRHDEGPDRRRQQLMRRGLRMLLETADGIDVVGEAGDGREALAAVPHCHPGVVVTDARMPGMDGLELLVALVERHPGLPVLVLSTVDDEDLVLGAVGGGAAGFLLKDVSTDALAEAIRAVAAGGMVIDPRVARVAMGGRTRGRDDPLAILTRTERLVGERVARGMTNTEIAADLVLAEGTVKNHVSNLLRKLDQRDRAGLALVLYRAFEGGRGT